MPKRISFSVKIQKINRIKTKSTNRNGRQKALSTRSFVGIWHCVEDPEKELSVTAIRVLKKPLRTVP